MRRFFPNFHIRQLEIIHYAFQQNGQPFNIEDLAKKLSFSVPCIKDDIHTLEQRYTPLIDIQWDKKNVTMLFKPNVTETIFDKLFYKESTMIQILKKFFFDPMSDPQELIDQLMLSKTSFYRLIRRFNDYSSDDYKFELSITPFAIRGDEMMIRSMFVELFTTITISDEWPFSNLSRKDIQSIVQMFMRVTGIKLERGRLALAWFTFAVNLYRTRQLYTIPHSHIPKVYQTYVDALLEDQEFVNHIQYFEQGFNLQLTPDNLRQLLFAVLPQGNLQTYDELITLDGGKKKSLKSLEQLKQYVEWVEDTYHVSHSDIHHITFLLYDLIHQQQVVPQYQPIFMEPNTRFIQQISSIPQSFFEKSYTFLKRYTRKVKIPMSSENINYIIVQLLIQWTELSDALENQSSKPNLMIISDINHQHERIIEKILRAHLGQRFNLVPTPPDFFDTQNIGSLSADIFISNFYVQPVPGKVIITIDHIPTPLVLQYLDELVNEYHLNKLQNLTVSNDFTSL